MVQSDINERALALCRSNADENGIESDIRTSYSFDNISEHFDAIYLNPPIHAGKEICNTLIEDAYDHLNPGGFLNIVIRKKHGAEGYLKRFQNMNYKYSIPDKKDGIYIIVISK